MGAVKGGGRLPGVVKAIIPLLVVNQPARVYHIYTMSTKSIAIQSRNFSYTQWPLTSYAVI